MKRVVTEQCSLSNICLFKTLHMHVCMSAYSTPVPSDFIWDFRKLPFPSHLGKYFIKIGKISAKIHEIGKIKVIFGLGMTPIYGLKNGQIKSLVPISFYCSSVHVRVQRGDRGSGPPWKITGYLGFYRNKHLDPPRRSMRGSGSTSR